MADLSRSESGDDAYDDLGGGGSGGSEYTEESYTGDEDGSDRGSRGSRGSRSEGSEDGSEEGSEEDEEEPILKYRRLRGDVTKILGGEALPAGDAASCMTVHPDFIVSCLDHDPTDPTPTPPPHYPGALVLVPHTHLCCRTAMRIAVLVTQVAAHHPTCIHARARAHTHRDTHTPPL